MNPPQGDPPAQWENTPIDGEEVRAQERPQRRPLRPPIRRAMWLHTFVLLSWALAQKQHPSSTCAAASSEAVNHVNSHSVQETDKEEWPDTEGSELEKYRDLNDEYRQQQHAGDAQWMNNNADDEDGTGVIVISMVDGTMAGLSRKTGETLWKQPPVQDPASHTDPADRLEDHHMRPNSGKDHQKKTARSSPDGRQLLKPLVSTTTTTASSSSGQDWKTAAVPSVDGRVYLTAGREGSGAPSATAAAEVTATTTVRELVARAPFVDARGRFYVGSRQSTAAALDRDTGEVLRVVPGDVHDGERQENLLEDRNVVWVGRVDYSVSLYDARTGESDVQFSTSEIMSVNDMVHGSAAIDGNEGMQHGGGSTQHAPRLMLPNGSGDGSFLSKAKNSLLVATPNGNVALRNPDTGQIEWVANETFDSAVAFAVESWSGASIGVDILPDATVPSSSMEYLSRELERQAEALDNQGGSNDLTDGDQTIVGRLSNGELFAMPLGKRQTSLTWASTLGLPHSHSVASSSSAVGSTKQLAKVPNIMGRQHSQHFQHDSSSSQRQNKRASCNSATPGFPACLGGSFHKNDDFARNFLEHAQQANPFDDNSVITIQYHPSLGYLPPDEHGQNLVQQAQVQTFMRVMVSWLPPTMALIFVLSFELGRRQRIKEERKKEAREREAASLAARRAREGDGPRLSTEAEPTETSMRSVGVIQVSDEVLGYGGHGTVVYKGTLDGRKVAVKRMLEAYHASADREISLLIESDGHPNVVRYFLKEVRGDFVYLALELCDMSLHDLICVLGSRRSYIEKGIISTATKSTLHQIASGVRHLHSLRIVHRDLKPANILLALCNRRDGSTGNLTLLAEEDEDDSVYPAYERGEYVAKISDMGLGKQLAGQSSFGISTLANSSIQGRTNGGGDGTVGAGPGSVGWQAPEVMALRWSPESLPSRAEGSSLGGEDSFAEASPVEGGLNIRTSRSVDIFSLGCIFYCTLVPGSHPFGEWYEREANIMRNKPSIEPLERLSADAYDLVKSMVDREPKARPTAKQICEHPFFWSPSRRLAFLCDVSDRLECDAARDNSATGLPPSELSYNTLTIERNASRVVGTAWDTKLDKELINNVSRFRTYDPSSVRDCLRLIRNKHHHYDELSAYVKERVGDNPKGLLEYFESRFPRLLMHCYSICRDYMTAKDPLAQKYRISFRAVKVQRKLDNQAARDDTAKASTIQGGQGRVNGDIDENFIVVEETSKLEAEVKVGTSSGAESTKIETPFVVLPLSDTTEKASEAACDSPIPLSVSSPQSPPSFPDEQSYLTVEKPLKEEETKMDYSEDIVVWEGSTAAKTLNCRGWMRSSDEWIRRTDASLRKRDANVTRCAGDGKFRTRLCNHWDASLGTFCPMRRKNKCVFAHGPVELRVKEGKRHRWGKLVDKTGNNSNPNHSGGEDTYGAARSIESVRKEEGKWNTDRARGRNKGRQGAGKKR